MTQYFTLEPEVAGGWGETTIADTTRHPPVVSQLHYEFDMWLGDDLLAAFPCYIVTERLYKALQQSEMTGFSFDEVTITTSGLFEDIQESSETKIMLTKFYWLKVDGEVGRDDFALLNTLRPAKYKRSSNKRMPPAQTYMGKYQIVVSERALNLLKQFNLEHCTVALFKN